MTINFIQIYLIIPIDQHLQIENYINNHPQTKIIFFIIRFLNL